MLTKLLAEKFAGAGLSVMAAAYRKESNLSKTLCRVPVDYIGKVADTLAALGYEIFEKTVRFFGECW